MFFTHDMLSLNSWFSLHVISRKWHGRRALALNRNLESSAGRSDIFEKCRKIIMWMGKMTTQQKLPNNRSPNKMAFGIVCLAAHSSIWSWFKIEDECLIRCAVDEISYDTSMNGCVCEIRMNDYNQRKGMKNNYVYSIG